MSHPKPKRHWPNPTYPDRALCGRGRSGGMHIARLRHRVTCEQCRKELEWQEREFTEQSK